jgi:HEAT repeat protein
MPGSFHLRALTILIVFLLASASAAGCGLVLPANPAVAAITPSITPDAVPSPSATVQASPPATAIPSTATPDPSFEGTRLTYDTQVSAQISQLLQSGVPAPAGFQMPPADQRQIILLAKNDRLYYLQSLLSPQITGGGVDAPLKLYVIYWYERGHELYYQSSAAFPASQTLTVHVQLVGEAYGHAYTFEGFTNDSGDGSQNDSDMLQKAVTPLHSLGVQAAEVESALDLIIGYGMGLDWDPTIQPQVRMDLLRPALQSENWSDRLQAAESLQAMGSAAVKAESDLIQAMMVEEDQFVVADGILKALGSIQPDSLPIAPDKSASPLQAVLADKNNISVLTNSLTALEWDKRALAAVILPRYGGDAVESVPALMGLIHDPNPEVRSAVINALGQLGPNVEGVVPALIQAQSDDTVGVRQSAARVFRYDRSQAQTVVPALIQALADPDNTVRLTAIESLQWLGRDADQAIPPLITTLKDQDAGIRQAASIALFYITNQGFGDDAAGWRNWWQQQLNDTQTPQPTSGTF